VGRIHQLTALDKATIVRMLATLAHAGYIVRDGTRQTYRVTGKTLQLSAGYNRQQAIGAIVSEDLRQFRQRVGWPSDVSILDEDAMLIIETSREAEPMRFFRHPGYRAQVLYTSLGRAYLAFCPERERQAFLERARADLSPEFALARDPEALDRLLETVRAQGFATMDESYSRENYDSQFFSIGVPIRTRSQVFGAMNIIYLRRAMTPEVARDQFLGPLTEVAATLAAKIEAHSGAMA
jgi:IclR family mhp operon transcriptional activator